MQEHKPFLRQAIAVHFPDDSVLRVGSPWAGGNRKASKTDPAVSAITVSDDLPSLYCYLERLRVWVGKCCVYEAPLHMVEGVEYELEADFNEG